MATKDMSVIPDPTKIPTSMPATPQPGTLAPLPGVSPDPTRLPAPPSRESQKPAWERKPK